MILGDEHGELLARHDKERKAKRNVLIAAALVCGLLTFAFNMYFIKAPYDLSLAYSILLIMLAVVLSLIVGYFTEKQLIGFIVIWLLLIVFQVIFPSLFEPRDRLADMPPGAKAAVQTKLKSAYEEYKPIEFKAYLYPNSKYIIFAEYYYKYNDELGFGSSRTEPHIVFKKNGKWEVLNATIVNQKRNNINIANTPYCSDRKDKIYKQAFCEAN